MSRCKHCSKGSQVPACLSFTGFILIFSTGPSIYQVLNKLNVNSEEGKTWAWQFQIYGLLSSKVGTKMSEEARQSLSGTGWLVSYSKGTAAPQLQSILVIYHQLFLFFEGRQIFGFFSCNCPIFKCEC